MTRFPTYHKWMALVLSVCLLLPLFLTGCSALLVEELPFDQPTAVTQTTQPTTQPEQELPTSKEEVAAYLEEHGELPPNFITKKEAAALGWESSEGNLWEVAPGKSIGGDRFGNYEQLLPDSPGRKWFECDINYEGGYRGPERLVYSSDGLIYYTPDHYETFTEVGAAG